MIGAERKSSIPAAFDGWFDDVADLFYAIRDRNGTWFLRGDSCDTAASAAETRAIASSSLTQHAPPHFLAYRCARRSFGPFDARLVSRLAVFLTENIAIMNMGNVLRSAASIFATLFCFWMEPTAAQQEIKLTKSITMLPDRPSGIEMIFKSRHNEHNGRDRFILTLFTSTTDARKRGIYYEHVLSFAGGKPEEFSLWETADCSFVQTMVFRVPSQRGPRLVVGTAITAPLSDDGEEMRSQADPEPQRIRIYVAKNSEPDDTGKSPIWLDSIAETVTQKALCSVEDVRNAIRLFLRQHIAELAFK